jgi:SpoVK/Ycf46/Vps4 family AAA+-type ATPase
MSDRAFPFPGHRIPAGTFLLVIFFVLLSTIPASMQGTNPVARRLAEARIALEQIRFQQQVQQITPAEAQTRTNTANQEIATIQRLMASFPRDVQADITRQADSLFQTRILPLREEWNQALQQKRQSDQSAFDQQSKEMDADARTAGKLQADRILTRERAQRNEVSQADAARADQQAEQQVLALHRKYDALDAERTRQGQRPYWATTFARAETGYANQAVAEGRLRLRLDDNQSELGKDAHRAADLTLTVQRNQYFLSQQAISQPAAQTAITTAQTLFKTIQQKYAANPDAAYDFRDRVVRLVREGAAAQQPQWERDAAAAKEAMRRAPAGQPPSGAPSAAPSEPDVTPGFAAAGSAATPQATRTPTRQRQDPRASTRRAASAAVPVTQAAYVPQATSTITALPWTTIGVVLLLVGGGAGAFVIRRRQRAEAPSFAAPAFSAAPAVRVTAPAPRPVSSAVSAAPAPLPATAGVKDVLFAQQHEKYQLRYNDAQDELTQQSAAVATLAPVLGAAHANLHTLAESLYPRMQAQVRARYGNLAKTLLGAVLLRPLWRVWRSRGLLVKIAIVVGIWWAFSTFVRTLVLIGPIPAAIFYGLVVVAGFFFERHLVLRAPLALLKKQEHEFKSVRLAHTFSDQRAEVVSGAQVLHGYSLWSTDKAAAAHGEVMNAALGRGAFVLTVGNLASYSVDAAGTGTPLTAASGEFMHRHGAVLHELMSDLREFAANTRPAMTQYGEALWRAQRIANQLPQLEALVRDVDRIEQVWRDTCVSDEVFEFLFRSIDMFNMRDAATPPGLLLFGGDGNGKKHLAQKIAETISARFEQVTPSKIASADQIEALWTSSRGADPVVLFVPNAQTVFPRPADGGSTPNTLEWIAEWEKHEPAESRVWVIMTSREDAAIDEAIVNHIGQDSKIEIKAPDVAGRKALFEAACRQYQVATHPSDSIIRSTGGASIQDLRRIVMAAKRAAAPGQPQDAHWMQANRSVRASGAVVDTSKTWDRLILPDRIKQQLRAACRILQDAQGYLKKGAKVPNILLWGPPGTGKTEVARTIANEAGVNFESKKLSDLKGKYLGESAQHVKAMFAAARAKAPTVLFIDEIDSAAKARGSEGADKLTEEIVGELLPQMDGAVTPDRPVFILAATNLPESLDRAVLERFTQRIEIPLPDEDARRQIFKGLLAGKPLAPGLDDEELAAAVAQRTDGFSGRTLVKLVDNATTQALARAGSADDFVLTRELVLELADQLATTDSDKVDPTARWDRLVADRDTMVQLKQLSDAIRHMETFQRQGIDPPRGAVLWGPPGTGKTQIAKTLANESGVRFMLRTGADLGHSAQEVRTVFDAARQKAPCILFFDEFEKAAQSREKGGAAEIVTELLAQMQGAKAGDRPIFVLAATNYLDQMDDAILSRFTYRIEIPNPKVEEREQLFAIALRTVPRAEFDVPALAAELARKGGGLSGRDINDVVVRAGQAAAQRALTAGTPDRVMLVREDLVNEVEALVRNRSDAVDPSARWDTLVVAEPTLKTLKQISTAVRNIEDRLKQGIEPPRGAVLYGPPGTGKTQIAKTLANESGVQFVSATAKDITGQYVGESTQKVGRLFAEARKKAPCILFIDEFENAAASRTGTRGSGFADEVVTQLLAEMDGVKTTGRPVFVLAATNHLERIDAAVLSRFTYQVEVPNPTLEHRQRLFAIVLSKYLRVDFDVRAMAAELAHATPGMAGRQIGDLVKKAVQDAAQRAEEAGTPNEIVLTAGDLRAQLAPKGRPVSEADLTSAWSEIVLEPPVKETLLSMVRLFNAGSAAAPKGLLLWGPPGTGKTEIARTLAKSTGCEFLATDLTKLKGSYIGESGKRVAELWEKARTHGRAIIFVDECDGVFARRGGTSTDAAIEEITNAFLPMWDGLESSGQIWVVGATNKRDRIDEAIDSRFGEKIEIGLPDAAARLDILTLEMRKLHATIAVPEFAGKATSGFAGRNLSKVAAAVYRLASQNGGTATDDTWRQVISQFATSTSDAVDPNARWDTLILQEAVLKRLRRMSEMLKHAETLREQGHEPPRAALLSGPPGTGKTQIAKTLANESGLNFIAANPSDLKGAHLGESARMVRELFERARSKPTVLFIDEIESSAVSRTGGRSDQYTVEIVNELLTQMDGVKKTTGTVFVLAATNHPDAVDAAVLSRFDDRLEIPNPGPDERRRMIATFIGKRRVDFGVADVATDMAAKTDGLSGRDLMSLVRRASQLSAERALDAGTPGDIVLTREDLLSQIVAGA